MQKPRLWILYLLVAAQNGNSVDLMSYISAARTNDIQMKSSELDVQAAYQSYKQSTRTHWPTIWGETTYTRLGPKDKDDKYPQKRKQALIMTQPIWSLGQSIAEDIQDMQYEGSKFTDMETKRSLLSKHVGSYYTLLKTAKGLEMARERLRKQESIFEKFKTQAHLGRINEVELSRSQLNIENQRLGLLRMEKDFEIVERGAKELTGINFLGTPRLPSINRYDAECVPDNFPKLAEKKPMIRFAKLMLDVADSQINATYANYVPSFQFEGYWEKDYTQKVPLPNYRGLIKMSWNIINSRTLSRSTSVQRIAKESATMKFRKAISDEVAAMKDTYDRYQMTLKEADLTQKQKRINEELYRGLEKRLALGMISNYDLIESYDLVFSIREKLDNAEMNIQQSYISLLNQCGVLSFEKMGVITK